MQPTLSLGLALASGYFICGAVANSGFAASCNSFSFGRDGTSWEMVANCAYPDGTYNVATVINLGKCITNAGGTMYAQVNGGFGASCPSASLSGTVITASCGNGAGGYVTSSLDLNTFVGNQNGILCCFGICGGP